MVNNEFASCYDNSDFMLSGVIFVWPGWDSVDIWRSMDVQVFLDYGV